MRRPFLPPATLLLLALLGCSTSPAAPAASPAADASLDASFDAPGDVAADTETGSGTGLETTVYAHADLPRTTATQGLSATTLDTGTHTLFALQDWRPTIVPLQANDDYTVFTPGAPLALTGRPDAAWDGEGLALWASGFIAVTVETNPTVERFGMDGAYAGPVPLPPIYEDQRPGNKGNESLSVSPSGSYVFTANEQALLCDGDGPTKALGTIVRIAKLDASTMQGPQYAWRTEPLGPGTGGDMGVSELASLDDDTLLVLERGYQSDYGNTVRIFKTSLAGATDVSAASSLGQDAPLLPKQLVADLGKLPSDGFSHPGTQPNPILDNYEGLTIGPVLQDGRRLVFVTSDDNQQASQVARVLVLAVRGL